jgi:hypothetical protein
MDTKNSELQNQSFFNVPAIFQRRCELQHGRDQHQRDGQRQRRGQVVVPRDLQVLLRHQRRVLPLRHPGANAIKLFTSVIL